MTNVSDWLTKLGLLLNIKKTETMMFTEQLVEMTHSHVFLRREELEIVNKFTYLGVPLDSKV